MMPADDEADLGPLSVGQLFIEKYTILRQIGRGGYAFVYEAEHRFMRHHVAIKVLHRDGGVSKEMLARGQAEAQIQQRIKHDNVAEVHDAGITGQGQLYMIMELLKGRPCRAAMFEHGRIAVEEALSWAIQLGSGLQAAHDLGVIHRDVKPDNCFLTSGNRLKLLDFGIAKAIDLAAFATHKNMMLGTPHYMSPEQVMGKRLTPSTDIYSLGVMLYEALAGVQPVSLSLGHELVDVVALCRVIAYEPFTPLDELDASIPRYVADLIGTAYAKKEDGRFPNMKAFVNAATECLARYTADAKLSGVQLETRDLSQEARVRSDVVVKEQGSRLASGRQPPAPDTGPSSPPVFPPTISDARIRPVLRVSSFEPAAEAAPVVHTAPLVAPPAGSERPTVWAKPRSAEEASPPGARPAPVSSQPSRPAPAPQAPNLPSVVVSSVARPAAPTPAAPAKVVERAQPQHPSSAPRPQRKRHHLQTVLIPAALLGFVGVGAVALYLTRPVASASVAPLPPPSVSAAPILVPPVHPNPGGRPLDTAPAVSAEPATSAPPPAAPLGAPAPLPVAARAPAPATAAPSRKQSVAPRAASASAPSKSDVDKMEQRLHRLEQNLDGSNRKLIFE